MSRRPVSVSLPGRPRRRRRPLAARPTRGALKPPAPARSPTGTAETETPRKMDGGACGKGAALPASGLPSPPAGCTASAASRRGLPAAGPRPLSAQSRAEETTGGAEDDGSPASRTGQGRKNGRQRERDEDALRKRPAPRAPGPRRGPPASSGTARTRGRGERRHPAARPGAGAGLQGAPPRGQAADAKNGGGACRVRPCLRGAAARAALSCRAVLLPSVCRPPSARAGARKAARPPAPGATPRVQRPTPGRRGAPGQARAFMTVRQPGPAPARRPRSRPPGPKPPASQPPAPLPGATTWPTGSARGQRRPAPLPARR